MDRCSRIVQCTVIIIIKGLSHGIDRKCAKYANARNVAFQHIKRANVAFSRPLTFQSRTRPRSDDVLSRE